MAFSEIQIIGLDSQRTQESPTAPNFRLMFLLLSRSPPERWVTMFDQERSSAHQRMWGQVAPFVREGVWREAKLEGCHIVIDCNPYEVEKYHLKNLKRQVAATNKKYAAWLAEDGTAPP